ncbi:hypothetical protein N7373_18760 [Achromobacter mucicolens]|uniref:hypothetical protein n=1 Tax=Achromobacter mucicolens TaxID=1389922 RepID=UPI002449D2BA|nr:hypothetical protein [Achromobacter mucicolens]MDH0093499.1 hypothetical protein [Achromobacter mucicolens]
MNDPQAPATAAGPAALATTPPEPGWLLKAATCLVYSAMLAWTVYSSRPETMLEVAQLAFGGGMLLGALLLVVLGVFSLWKRFRTPRNRVRILLGAGVFLLAAVAVPLAERSHDNRQRDIANTEIRKAIDALRMQAGGGSGMPEDVPAIDPSPKATGAYGEMERAMKTVAGERLAQHRAYLQELKEIGLPRLFDAGRLARDSGLIESRLILEQVEKLVPAYRQQSLDVLDAMPALVRSLTLSEPEKAKILKALADSRAASNEKLRRVWDLETQILHEFGLMITLLDDNRQFWYADRNELKFGRNADLTRFHQHQDTVNRLAREQEQLATQSLAAMPQAPLR